MNYRINLNTVDIFLKGCSQNHIDYFRSQFFQLERYEKAKITVEVTFKKKITVPKLAKKIEENIFVTNKTYILDTKKQVLKVDFSMLSTKKLTLLVEENFDLYYLYTFFVEPLFIIFGIDRGLLFVHSSAVTKEGKGYLFPAWRHTGKTQTLLSLTIDHNFLFMGDDYTVLYNKKMYVYPKKINLFSYNLKEYPALYTFLEKKLALRLKITTAIKNILTRVSYLLPGMLGKVLFRISELAEVSTNFKTTPEKLSVAVTHEAKHTKTAILQASVQPQKMLSLSKNEVAYKVSETIVFELADFLNIYKASSYVIGKELNRSIATFLERYSKLTKKYLGSAELFFVDERGTYFVDLKTKYLK